MLSPGANSPAKLGHYQYPAHGESARLPSAGNEGFLRTAIYLPFLPLQLLGYKNAVKWRWLFLLLLLCSLAGYWRYYEWRDHSQDGPILAAARRYDVEPALVKAVIWRESRFNPDARGSRGEIGLMQVIPNAAAKDWAEAEHFSSVAREQLLDPGTNTLAGAWYLAKLCKRYAQTDNPLPYVLADYNAGRGNVLKWNQGPAATNSAAFLRQINFPGTKSYVRSVMRRYEHYKAIFPPKKGI